MAVLSALTLPLALSPTVVAMLETVPMTAAVIFYWNRAMHLSWDGRPVPAWRQICFGSGIFIAAFMLYTPWGYLAEELVIFHMIEHLMIGDVASLLVVLGLTKSILQPILAIPFFNRLQVLVNPIVSFFLWSANLFFWHIPAMYDAAYGGALIHGVEHGAFFFFGAMMWMPVFGPLPTPTWFGPGAKIIFVAVARFTAGILGNILMWTQFELYKNYSAGHVKWGITAVEDQSIAGVVMMMEGIFFILGVLAWTYFRSAAQSSRKQDLIDLAYTSGVEMDEERIERAVRSGHDDLLEKRIRAAAAGEVESETTEKVENEPTAG